MSAAAADLERNRIRRDIEGRCLAAIEQAHIPPTRGEVARRARITNQQATVALVNLAADGRIRVVWDPRREANSYERA